MRFLIIFLLLFILLPYQMNAQAISDKFYSYNLLVNDLETFKEKHPEIIDYHSLGTTDYGREVWAVQLGRGERVIFLNGSHHAREWMTTQLLMKMIQDYAKAYEVNGKVSKYNVYDILNEYTIWFVPMVNPDGVTLQQEGLSAFPKEIHKRLIEMNEGSKDFTRWKANANGVDLNRQYPANWYSNGEHNKPSWAGYKGKKPFQEKEVQYLRDFTLEIEPDMAISYHSSGEILFWYFHNKYKERDYQIAKELSNITEYRMVKPTPNPGGKGYTDWFIKEFDKPGLTPEISPYVGDRHVPAAFFPDIWEENKTVGLWMASESEKLNSARITSIKAEITLDKNYSLYKSPSFDSITLNELSPQVVNAYKRQGNWFLIDTNIGNQWIYVSQVKSKLNEQLFLDVPSDYWAKNSIDFVYEHRFMSGTGDLYFSPSSPITRAQASAVMVDVFKLSSDEEDKSHFPDVPVSHWAHRAIKIINNNNIMSGTKDGLFNPNKAMTREQMAAIIARLYGEPHAKVDTNPFLDIDSSRWSAGDINFVKEKGIFGGDQNGNFRPRDPLSRAQFSALIQRIVLSK